MSKECPQIIRRVSLKMQVAILKYIGQHALHIRWPAFWSEVRTDFDNVIAAHIASKPPGIATRAQYVKGLQAAFGT